MSVPRPRQSAYLRRLHEQRLQAQVTLARAALRSRKWQVVGIVGSVLLFLVAAGAALGVFLDRVLR